MGYRISAFSASELNRISLPGEIASTLFWALPAGSWKPQHLDLWWQHFTRTDGACNRYGMLLVKEGFRATKQKADAIADFGDLIPNFEKLNRQRPRDSASIFITSAAYPQPGWGVLINVSGAMQEEPQLFEDFLERVLNSVASSNDLVEIEAASEAQKDRERLRRDRPKLPENQTDLKQESERLAQCANDLDLILRELQLGQLGELIKLLNRVSAIGDFNFGPLLKLTKATERIKTSFEKDPTGTEALFVRYRDCKNFETLLQDLSPQDGGVIRSLHLLYEQGIIEKRNKASALIDKALENLSLKIQKTISPLLEKVQSERSQKNGEILTAEEDFKKSRERFKKESEKSEHQLRQCLVKASQVQWTIGPKFLKAIEDTAREENIKFEIIKWEPVRMIGWKIMSECPDLNPRDLAGRIYQLLDKEHKEDFDLNSDFAMSGSLFADYIYYIVSTKSRLSPREATLKIVNQILSFTQIETALLNSNIDLTEEIKDAELLADELLTCWGWSSDLKETGYPILKCIEPVGEQRFRICKSSNDTRTILEGCFQDLARVTFNALGLRGFHARREIEDQIPAYIFSSKKGPDRFSIDDELMEMTSGSASMLLTSFMPRAFPNKENELMEFTSLVKPIRETLNSGSHYPPTEMTENQKVECGTQIHNIVMLANEIIGEFPWHFTPKQTIGSAPQIVTGYAWSHSHPEERLIRILVNEDEVRGKDKLLVWNRNKINPVMPDATIL